MQDVRYSRHARVGADVDAREGHAQIEIQGAAQGGQLIVQAVVIKARAQAFGNVQNNGNGGREFVTAGGGRAGCLGLDRGGEGFIQLGFGVGLLGCGHDAPQHIAYAKQGKGQGKQLRLGKAGHHGEQEDHAPGHHQGAGV